MSTEPDDLQELARLREMLHSLPGMVYQVGLNSQLRPGFTFVSDGVQELFGRSPEAMRNDPEALVAGVHPDDRPMVSLGFMHSARDRKVARVSYRYVAPDGAWRWVRTHAVPIMEPGGGFHWNGFTYDITEEAVLQERLADAKAAAEAASQAKSDFTANMSHEIRTPMNAILSFAYLGQRQPDPDKQREYFAKIESSARALLDIVNDVLDLSKVEAGRLELAEESFSLAQVLDHFESVVSLRAQEKGLDLRIETDPAIPATLVGDSVRLGQVLLNLGSNAVKFTETGAVTVHVSKVAESGGDDPVLLEFRVQDTGIGLTAEQASRVFEPFVQADSSTTRRFGGTGLGLSICRRLVHLLGGTIDVDSEPGRGSTFRFTARFRRRAERTTVPRRVGPRAAHAVAGLHALVVDDHEANLEVARALLESAGVEVTVAGSGPEAIEHAARQRFDAIFLDVRMPGMDGIEAARRIRAGEPRGVRVPIVALTANVMTPDRERCLAAGMDDFVGKPIEVDLLFETLARVVAAAGAPAPRDAVVPAPARAETEVEAVPLRDHDFEAARRGVECAPQLYARLAQRFISDDPIPILEEQIAAGQWPDATRTAHTLKGVAGQLGALRVQRLAATLETRLGTGALPPGDAIATLSAAMEDARIALTRFLITTPSSAPATTGQAPALAALRSRLEQELEDGEDAAWDAWERFNAALAPDARQRLAGVGAHIASEEYVLALALLRERG